MAKLNFPDPAVTQSYEEAGILWTWNSTLGVWSTDCGAAPDPGVATVNRIIAGDNITISPTDGYGDVTINAELPDIPDADEIVTPLDYGAKGDGVTDDRDAVQQALESGKVVQGLGLTYAIDGDVKPSTLNTFINARLKQIGDTTTGKTRTLNLEGISTFTLNGIYVDMGDNTITEFADSANAGIWIGSSAPGQYIEDFTVTNCSVTGNGCGTGIIVRRSKRFTLLNCIVKDRISEWTTGETDDSQNGIAIADAANFEVVACTVYNLFSRINGSDENQWTRGFLFTSIRDCTITSCLSVNNDQGFDFSGSLPGNQRFNISGCTAAQTGTHGFKFANTTRDGLITGCLVSNTGYSGFVCSSNDAYDEKERTQRLTFSGCKVVNSLNSGWANYRSVGFYADADGSGKFPRDIKWFNCSVVDNQDTPTTEYGFVNSVDPSELGINTSNTCRNCNADNIVVESFLNMQWAGVSTKGVDDGIIPNENWTSVNWANPGFDQSFMHDQTSGSNPRFYIRETGLYFISSTVMFNSGNSDSGDRRIRVVKTKTNGQVYLPLEGNARPNGVNVSLNVNVNGCLEVEEGDYLKVEVWQNSGSDVVFDRDESNITIYRIA